MPLDKSVLTTFLSGITINEKARENLGLHAERNADTENTENAGFEIRRKIF